MSDEVTIKPKLNRAQVRQKNRVVLPEGLRADKDIKIGDVLDFIDLPDKKDYVLVKINRLGRDPEKVTKS